MKAILSLILSVSCYAMYGQHLDVEGHSRIRGNLDINHMDDSTSMFIGRKAGVNTNFDFAKSNTFVGILAGFTNTNGASNSFYGRSAGFSNFIGFNNSFFGESAGFLNNAGWDNSFFGRLTGYSTTDGNGNSFFGTEAGQSNSTGNYNTAFGYRALHSNTIAGEGGSGNQNVAIGAWSLENATARGNTGLGTESLRSLSIGADNTAVGEHALRSLGTGSSNTALGYSAMINTNESASGNVAIGDRAGENARGNQNSFVGASAGFNLKEGHGNVFLGAVSEPADTTAENQIVIGSGARGIADNTAVLGNENISDVYISEDAGAVIHAANTKLNSLPSDVSSDSIVVLRPDSTLAVRETSSLIQSFGQMGGSPLAFAFIDINGNVIKSTGNITASFSGNTGISATSNIYSVSVTGESLTPTSHIAFVTPVMVDDSQPDYTRTIGVVFVGGTAKIRFYSTGSAPTSAFNIIFYKYN